MSEKKKQRSVLHEIRETYLVLEVGGKRNQKV